MNEKNKHNEQNALNMPINTTFHHWTTNQSIENAFNKDIPSDVLGSYTGVGEGDGVPEQDADDL